MAVTSHELLDEAAERLNVPELLTLSETARALRLQVSTLRAWRLHKRNLPFVQIGRKIFVRRSDVADLISSSVIPTRTPEEP